MKRGAWVYPLPSTAIAISLLFSGCGDQHPEMSEVSAPRDGIATVHADSAYGADSVPIYYEVHGQGDTALVLVHGWGIHGGFWEHQVEAFEDASVPRLAGCATETQQVGRLEVE